MAALGAAPGGTAASVAGRSGVAGPLVVRVPPASPATAPRAAAVVGSLTTAGDLRGLAASSCVSPGTDQWLVGGDTRVGDSTQLVLDNAGLTAATVTVTAYGENGKVALGSSASLVVPAGKQVVRLLESAAAGQDRLAVDVRASGGVVAAHLQHSALDGIVAQGVDLVVPGATPGRHLAVADVVSRGEQIADPRAPQLRLLAPDHAASVTVGVWGADGRFRLRGAEQVSLDAGSVVDVGLGGMPAGSYTVTVDATQDVVAGVVEQRPGTAAKGQRQPWDLAWSPAQSVPDAAPASLPAAGSLALVPGTSSAVSLAAVPADRAVDAKLTGQVAATVRVFDDSGAQVATRPVTIAAGVTTTLDVGALAPGKHVAGVSVDGVTATGGASLVWGAVASAGAAASGAPGPSNGQLFSVLAPVPSASGGGSVTVSQDPTLGLG
jgi:hypothetical protein